MKEWWIFLGSACATALTVIKIAQIVTRRATRMFTRAVDDHVAPVAREVKEALHSVTTVLESVRMDVARDREETRERLAAHRKSIDENAERLDEHENRISTLAERVSTVEGAMSFRRPDRNPPSTGAI